MTATPKHTKRDGVTVSEFIRDMQVVSPPKPAVDSESAHDCARDWAEFVTGGESDGEEWVAAYQDAYSRIKRQFHIVAKL